MRIRFKRRHEHPWKLMTAGSIAAGMLIVLGLVQTWYALSVVALILLLTMTVQWLTIDPPYVDDNDLYGPEPKTKRNPG